MYNLFRSNVFDGYKAAVGIGVVAVLLRGFVLFVNTFFFVLTFLPLNDKRMDFTLNDVGKFKYSFSDVVGLCFVVIGWGWAVAWRNESREPRRDSHARFLRET